MSYSRHGIFVWRVWTYRLNVWWIVLRIGKRAKEECHRPDHRYQTLRAVAASTGADRDNAIVLDFPARPDPSPSTSPVDTPTKRQEPSPSPVSSSIVKCQSPVYIALQDHYYQLPECTNDNLYDDPALGMSGDVWPWPNQPENQRRPSPQRRPAHENQRSQSSKRQRRRASSPPRYSPHQRNLRIRSSSRVLPYDVSPTQQQQLPARTFPRGRPRNLFEDFLTTLPRPFPVLAAEPPASRETPSPDLMQELYQHNRRPLDLTHLTIVPSWAMKSKK